MIIQQSVSSFTALEDMIVRQSIVSLFQGKNGLSALKIFTKPKLVYNKVKLFQMAVGLLYCVSLPSDKGLPA